jgi:hypothetical protein
MFLTSRMVGVEFDPAKVEHAKENFCCKLEFMDLLETESLPFTDNRFDLVISHGFLGRAKTPYHWIHEMARVSAEGLIISTPTPIGYRWLQKVPGVQDTRIAGTSVFDPVYTPRPLRQVKTWLQEADIDPE